MGQVGTGAVEARGDGPVSARRAPDVLEHEREGLIQREDRDEVRDIAQAGGLVQRHAQAGRRDHPQVDLPRARGIHEPRQGPALHLDADRVEEVLVHDPVAQPPERVGQDHRARVGPLGDAAEAVGPVVDGIHARHHGQQHLGRADVARRLFPADMLLARLQRHAQGRAAIAVLGHADDPARHVALVLVAGGEEGGVRAAVPHRHAEALAVAHRDVGAPLARRHQQCQRQQVGRRRDQRPGRMCLLADRAEVMDRAVRRGILQEAADDAIAELELLRRLHLHRHPARLGAGDHHGDCLRMAVGIHQEDRRIVARCHHVGERHRLGGRRGLVEQRGVGDGEPGEVGDHRLEVEQRLEPALRNLRLVGRVGRVPARVLQDVPLDDLGDEGAVVAHADVGTEDPVLVGHPAQRLQDLALAPSGREVERAAKPDVLGHHGVDEVIERGVAQVLHHLGHVFLPGADMPVGKVVRVHHLERRHPVRPDLVGGVLAGGRALGGGHTVLVLQLVKKGTRSKCTRPGQEARGAG